MTVTTRDQAIRLCYSCLPLLVAGTLPAGALAEEKVVFHDPGGMKLPNYTRSLDSRNFESIKYGKGFKVKGWRIREDVYFGGVKVNGEYGPGIVFDKGGYVWGFNHERVEFQLRF